MLVTNPFRRGTWTRTELDEISKRWWLLLLGGGLSIVAGGIILLFDWTLSDLAWFIGALLVIRGTLTLFSMPLDASSRGWSVAQGLLEIGVGIAVWVWPTPTLLVIAAFIGWLLLFEGTMLIVGSIEGRRYLPYWGLLLAAGIAQVLVAFYLLSRPTLTLWAAVMAIGLASIVYGVVQTVLAFEVKQIPDDLDDMSRRFDDEERRASGQRVST